MTNSIWHRNSTTSINTTPLGGNIKCDVIIVGGGFSGCSSALHLAEAGQDVVILEANNFGYGASSRNVGLINAGLWTRPDIVEKKLGIESGKKLNKILATAPEYVFNLIKKYNMDCNAKNIGTLHLSHNLSGMQDIENRAEQLIKRGANVEILNASQTERLTGSPIFKSSLLDHRAGVVNPLDYLRGLAKAAIDNGAKLFNNSPAISFTKTQDKWLVKSNNGEVIAKKIIIAVNAYGGNLIPQIKSNFIPIYFSQFATAPLPTELRQSILPQGHGCWDTSKIMRSFRLDSDGRLIIGTMGRMPNNSNNYLKRWANTTLLQIFPQLARFGDIKWEDYWDGVIAYTPNNMPRLYQLDDNMLAIMGYNGRGIAPASIFGKAISDYIISEDQQDLPFPLTAPKAIKFHGLQSCFYEFSSQMEHRFGIISKLGM